MGEKERAEGFWMKDKQGVCRGCQSSLGRKEDQGQKPDARSPDWRTNVSEGEARSYQQLSEGRDLHWSKVLIRGRPAQSSPEWEHHT